MTAGVFTAEAWQRAAGVREAVDALPFLRELEDGTLPRATFRQYLAQDALYLAEYGRALAACARQAGTAEELIFWSTAAAQTVEVERELHAAHVDDLASAEPSPTTTAYTSYLLGLAGGGSHPVLAAAVLPCFWVYDDVGTRLAARLGPLEGHPYADWIGTYGDPEFAATTATARDLVDGLAAAADERTRERMHAAFRRGMQYEWMFWDAAYRGETWPV
ncbi:TenA family protein [Georgenia alba]|uniref:TenA family protein n=1 Tax=Georgenia alba TaxID=2233858 RepID=A0ABW2Q4H3_9MICO